MRKVKSDEVRLDTVFAALLGELNDASPACPKIRFAMERQVQRARKKARYHRPELRAKAISDFLDINERAGSTCIDLDEQLVRDAKYFLTVVLERFATRINPENIQDPLDVHHMLSLWRFGPGSSNGIKGTHAAEKIQQKMTCTARCKPWVLRLRRQNVYFALKDQSEGSDGTLEVRGSRLTTVLKNETTERTIAIEPSGNMALQLALGAYLEDVLRMIGLDIRSQQEKNKLLAMLGSVDGTLCTIDLKSASDLILMTLVRLLYPPKLVQVIEDIRSAEIDVPGKGWVGLNMVSTMGNGFTFPLMTLTLTALLYAYRTQKRTKHTFWVDWKRTGIFGDDIIIETSEYEGFTALLEAAGLIVNHDKSFHTGSFRESCGGDYYEGYDVTPFYIKSLATTSDIYVAINQVLTWGAKHRMVLHRTLLTLKAMCDVIRLVPEWHGDHEGIRTASCPVRYTYLRPQPPRVRLGTSHFAMMLAVGGYLIPDGDGLFYSPRPFKTRVKAKAARLPRGFRDGSDPLSRPESITTYIGAITPLLFA